MATENLPENANQVQEIDDDDSGDIFDDDYFNSSKFYMCFPNQKNPKVALINKKFLNPQTKIFFLSSYF